MIKHHFHSLPALVQAKADTRGMALSGAWNMQVAGRTASGGSLDLTHFERQQATIRFNFNF